MFRGFGFGKFGLKFLVRHEWVHRVGYVTDTAQSTGFQCEFGGGNVDAHAANHNGHVLI